jgi:hypothetical protein
MSDNNISPDLLSAAHNAVRNATPRASLTTRMIARLRADQFDRMLAVGVPAPEGSALAVHQARLTSMQEREAIARSLRQVVRDARAGADPLSSRIPLHLTNVAESEDVIDTVALRLQSPRPVNARGMARLRRLLADGCGPLYQHGRGDLKGRLGAALAEL